MEASIPEIPIPPPYSSPERSLRARIGGLLADYFRHRRPLTGEGWREGLEKRMPFIEGGRVGICANELRRHVVIRHRCAMKITDLTADLRVCGFEGKQIGVPAAKSTVHYWTAAIDDLKEVMPGGALTTTGEGAEDSALI